MVPGDGSTHGPQAAAVRHVPQGQRQQGAVQEPGQPHLLSLLTGAGQPPDGVGGAEHRALQPPHHRYRSLPRVQRPPHVPLLLSHIVRPHQNNYVIDLTEKYLQEKCSEQFIQDGIKSFSITKISSL